MNFESVVKDEKIKRIQNHLQGEVNVSWLRQQAISQFGLVNKELRKTVWPIIVGVTDTGLTDISEVEQQASLYARQVALDTCRMKSLMPYDISEADKEAYENRTTSLILSVLVRNPKAHYYQGFHEIAFVMLSVLGDALAQEIINKLVNTKFSIFMQETMRATETQMDLIFSLLHLSNPLLLRQIESVGLGPHFALSWVITWFAHVLPTPADVHRLYDLFLAADRLMLIYLSVAVVLRSAEEVHGTPDDFGLLHSTLTHLPKRHPVEQLIACALKLFSNHPPAELFVVAKQRLAAQQANQNGLLVKAAFRRHRLTTVLSNMATRLGSPSKVMFTAAALATGILVAWYKSS